jgi:predicted HTH domain antitoxin
MLVVCILPGVTLALQRKSLCITMYSNSVAKLLEKSTVVTVRLSSRDLNRVEAVRILENVDRSTLIKEFIEDGLRRRVVHLYQKGKLTSGRAAEILGIPLREFLEILEREGVPVNWDSESVKEYLKARYGE